MKEKKLVVHIGLHKTGTTFLQEQIFPNIESYQLIRGWNSIREMVSVYDKSKTFLISDEGLSGDFINGSYKNSYFNNISMIRELFVNPKIIVGFRRHDQFILSLYKQYLHQGGHENFENFFDLNNNCLISPSEIYYTPRIEKLEEIFGEVFVYTQETLSNRQPEFIKALSEFLQIEETEISKEINSKKVNAGVRSNFQVETLKKLNRINYSVSSIPFIPSFCSKFFKKMGLTPRTLTQRFFKNIGQSKYKLEPDLKSEIQEIYREDWNYICNKVSY